MAYQNLEQKADGRTVAGGDTAAAAVELAQKWCKTTVLKGGVVALRMKVACRSRNFPGGMMVANRMEAACRGHNFPGGMIVDLEKRHAW